MILILIALSGCSKNSESETAKTGNANQTPTVLNNNASANLPVNTTTAASAAGNSQPQPTGDKEKNNAPPVKAPTPVISTGANDMVLFQQARAALNADSEFVNAVIIEIKEGALVLNGSVSSEAQKTKAAQLVQNVKGIKSVKNNLRVAR